MKALKLLKSHPGVFEPGHTKDGLREYNHALTVKKENQDCGEVRVSETNGKRCQEALL